MQLYCSFESNTDSAINRHCKAGMLLKGGPHAQGASSKRSARFRNDDKVGCSSSKHWAQEANLSQLSSSQRPCNSSRHLRTDNSRAVACAAQVSPSSAVADEHTDVVVIGSGIGGLSAGALLAKYGSRVIVAESHSVPGGACHTFERKTKSGTYHFESGPSLYTGMGGRGPSANPLAHVLQALGEELDLITYDTWHVLLPEGNFLTKVGAEDFVRVLHQIRGPQAVKEWHALQEVMRPLSRASAMLPPVALRADAGAILTAGLRYLPTLVTSGVNPQTLTGPFSKVLEGVVSDPFLRNWLDLLCFLLSGLPSDGTIAAEMAFMMKESYRPGCVLDFPRGGSQALVSALIRGLEKHGGRLMTSAHVEQVILDEKGRATGVVLRGGRRIHARKAVVSGASVWDTLKLLPAERLPAEWRQAAAATPACPSFMHLHVGFDGAGLEGVQKEIHHIVVNCWDKGVDAQQNVVLISTASMLDPSLAPQGKHVLHAYLPATEPYELWQGVERNSPRYQELKEERGKVLWDAVKRVIPDIEQRAEVSMIGTPLTHGRYLRRHKGSYGPAIKAGEGLFPGPATPVPGLYCAGDSTFPGIGLPAVAASGNICANTLSPVTAHWSLLNQIGV